MFDPTPATQLTPPVSARDHTEGPASAASTLLEFGDYQCPYCGEAQRTIEAVQQRLGGHLRFAFRNFPLVDAHPYAEGAAEAAEAAAAQGKFWEMHDLLYDNQNALDQADLLRYAKQLDLDVDRFRQDVESHRYHERIKEDVQSGEESGIPGTPTFFINGELYQGSPDVDSMVAALQQAANV